MRPRRLLAVLLILGGAALGLVAKRGLSPRERLELRLEDGSVLELRPPAADAVLDASRDLLAAARS
jgi:hypothetical protein